MTTKTAFLVAVLALGVSGDPDQFVFGGHIETVATSSAAQEQVGIRTGGLRSWTDWFFGQTRRLVSAAIWS